MRRLFFMGKRKLDGWIDRWTSVHKDKIIGKFKSEGKNMSVKDVTCKIVANWYMRTNSHGCMEGHLPGFVPLDYIEHILLPRKKYDNLRELLRKTPLSDGRALESLVVPLSGDDFNLAAQRWQADWFYMRMKSARPATGLGAQPDLRSLCFGIEGLKGREVFLPLQLPNPKSGSEAPGFVVGFRAKGQHIRLTLSNRGEATRGKDADGDLHVYMVVVGMNKNQVTWMRRSNQLGAAVKAQVTRAERPDAMAFPCRYRQYWVTFNVQTGCLRLLRGGSEGKADDGKEGVVLLEWTDPVPHQDIKYLAISCWDTPVDFSTFKAETMRRDAW